MKINRPLFWNSINLISILLYPLSLVTFFINILKKTSYKKEFKIKTICIGNLYVGGTGKTPLSIMINKILRKNYKTVLIKKKYYDQIDEQKILKLNGNLICKSNRKEALEIASKKKYQIAILDDGLQEKNIKYKIVSSFNGKVLNGIRYDQLLKYKQPTDGESFKVLLGDFVTTEDGTGIVHIAPTFGADDMKVAKDAGVPPLLVDDGEGNGVPLVDLQGRFRPEMAELGGKYVKNEYYEAGEAPDKSVDVEIAIRLKEESKAFKVEKYAHSYPHCWRTDKPILY